MQPGESALIDGREAYQMEYEDHNVAFGVALPREWLRRWVPDVDALVPQVWRRDQGWGGVLDYSLASLTSENLRSMALGDTRLFIDHLGSLLALAVGERAPQALNKARADMLSHVRDTIRGAYHDPSLTPAAVAKHHDISVRSLHLLFARAESSFGGELLAQRLNAAVQMLRDARFNGLSIKEITRRCGFVNPSHFARHFPAAVRPLSSRDARAALALACDAPQTWSSTACSTPLRVVTHPTF